MDFFKTVESRRSIRRFTEEPVPDQVIEKALDAALLAPNSSNTQTWDFYWVKTTDKKQKLVEYCLSQSAARKAQHLIVVTADPKKWKRSRPLLMKWVNEIKAPKPVIAYYEKLIPLMYNWGFLNSFGAIKFLMTLITGLFRPIPRGPNSKTENQLVAVKSAALASENFVLAIQAQGYDTCMMEGFDEWRVCSLLRLSFSARVVMVIAVGRAAPDGTWGPRFQIPKDSVVHRI